MNERLRILRAERASIVTEMRAMVDLAEREKRDLTDEELSRHGELYGQQENRQRQIEAEERQIELDRRQAEAAGGEARATPENRGDGDGRRTAEDLRFQAFRSWLATGHVMGEGAEEFRALQADHDSQGGFLVAPEQFVQQLIQALDDEVHIRSMATTFPVGQAQSLGVPSLDADPGDADWTAEIATGTEDSAMRLGKRSLHPHPLAKRIKVSNTLLRRSLLPAESLVTQRLVYKFGVSQEKAFLLGSGAQQPLGVFVASADGIPTSRDFSTGNTMTEIGFDGLIEAKYGVKAQYWPRSTWLFHRDAVKQISKLKDGDGQYLWRPSAREGEPDMLLGRPLRVSEFAPNTFTSGLYVGIFGDFTFYWIADALAMQMQRLVELYAETNQVGFIGRLETDGMPVLAEAFARVKLA
jgi:HK97 family phage major capsid protein